MTEEELYEKLEKCIHPSLFGMVESWERFGSTYTILARLKNGKILTFHWFTDYIWQVSCDD